MHILHHYHPMDSLKKKNGKNPKDIPGFSENQGSVAGPVDCFS